MLAALAVLGAVLDLGLVASLPTKKRQVREPWLREYRGWVSGVGFGFQLGLGFVTVVNTSLVYLTFAAALLSGSAAAGVAIGATLGVVRWLSVLPGVVVDRPARLAAMTRRIEELDRPTARVAVGYQLALAGLAVLATTFT